MGQRRDLAGGNGTWRDGSWTSDFELVQQRGQGIDASFKDRAATRTAAKAVDRRVTNGPA